MTIQETSARATPQRGAPTHAGLDGEDRSEIKDTLSRSATDLTSELRREGQRLMKDATQSATSLANEKKGVAADYLRAVAEAAEASCDVLEERGYAGSSRFLTHAVNGLGEFTDSLATREPSELLNEVVAYARRNPALFLGAALFAGFSLTRLAQAFTASGAGEEGAADENDEMAWDDDTDDTQDEDADTRDALEDNVHAS